MRADLSIGCTALTEESDPARFNRLQEGRYRKQGEAHESGAFETASTSASLWMKIFLKEPYRVKPSDIVWHVGRTKELIHGGALGLDKSPPPGIRLNWLTEGQTTDVMLDRGELDAAYWIFPTSDPAMRSFNSIDSYGGTSVQGNPRIRKLFPDGECQIIAEYYQKTRVIPANHMIVVQKRILEEHPWVALELFKAFQNAKEVAYERAKRLSSAYLLFEGDDYKNQRVMFGDDPYRWGLEII